jgi:hypothetical protein
MPTQTWTVQFAPGDTAPAHQDFFRDVPVMDVQFERLLKEPRIQIVCTFYKAGDESPLVVVIQADGPPFVTTATGVSVEAYPADSSAPTKVEEVSVVWPFKPAP